jgi:hypothetical protein
LAVGERLGNLKPIDALIRASNAALRLPHSLINAGVIPPVQ